MLERIPIGSLVIDPSSKRLFVVIDYVETSSDESRTPKGIIYVVHPLDGRTFKAYRYGYEIAVINANTNSTI